MKLRRAQTIQPFGVGSIFGFNGDSFIVKDIKKWNDPKKNIHLKRLSALLGGKKLKSFSDFTHRDEKIETQRFPTWYHCPNCKKLKQIKSFEPETPKCSTTSCKNQKLSPMRFVAYCNNGHLSEINWAELAHYKTTAAQTGKCEYRQNPRIAYTEFGSNGGDFDQMIVNCEDCGSENNMTTVYGKPLAYSLIQDNVPAGNSCCGSQPWFWYDEKNYQAEPCKEQMMVEPRGSSSIYRPKIISALDITSDHNISDFVNNDITQCDDFQDIVEKLERKFPKDPEFQKLGIEKYYLGGIESICDDFEIDQEEVVSTLKEYISAKYSENSESDAVVNLDSHRERQEKIIEEELEIFKMGQDILNENFHISFSKLKEQDGVLGKVFSKIAKINKLREIRVLTSFTRGKGSKEIPVDIDGKKDWLPAVEAFGEGIYFELNSDLLKRFFQSNKEGINKLTETQINALEKLREENNSLEMGDSNLFILTHTLSHFLIRQLTFDSGYSSSALRERIFVDDDDTYAGILIYTSELDAEGTMGGLVDQARTEPLNMTLQRVIESSKWCSMDPVCRETEQQGFSGLNRSSCHCCSLIAETSCTYQNTMLNRLLLGASSHINNEISGLFEFALNH